MMRTKNVIGIALGTAALLAGPLVAMQFTREVSWTGFDFLVAGILLFSTGLLFELAANQRGDLTYRMASVLGLGAALFLIWSNLAVGLIGSEDNAVNLLYFGVIAVGLIGSAIARFNPHGMARTLLAMAVAHALVPVVALQFWKSDVLADAVRVAGVSGFFVTLFVMSALLFRQAGERQGQGA